MRTIILEPYTPKWAEAFEKIKNEIYPAISDCILSIEHVGSTSVPGLWAKPIIDIDIVIDDGMLPAVIEKLQSIGYTHEGDLGIQGREAFKYDAKLKKRYLALRDFLRKNPEYCEKNSRIKIEMAKRYPHDIDSYIKGKQPVIKEIYHLCGIEL